VFVGGAVVGAASLWTFNVMTRGAEEEIKRRWNDPNLRAYWLLEQCKVPEIPEDVSDVYVERHGLEDRIDAYVRQELTTEYLVVVGPRGGGKSTAVKKVLRGRGKVVYVKLDSEVSTIQERLRKNLGLPSHEQVELSHAFQGFKGLHGVEKPVLVVELDSNVSPDSIGQQSSELKTLCTDDKLAHGILVLSDANAAFKLKEDPDRQQFLWVDDLDGNEMNTLLDKFDVLSTDAAASTELRRRLRDEVGANAQGLFKTAAKAKSAAAAAVKALPADATEAERVTAASASQRRVFETFIEVKQRKAYNEVNNLLTQAESKDKFRRLFLALLNKPSGVGEEDVDFAPSRASEEFKTKGFRAVTFSSEAKLFQFYSKAHQYAAGLWFEREA